MELEIMQDIEDEEPNDHPRLHSESVEDLLALVRSTVVFLMILLLSLSLILSHSTWVSPLRFWHPVLLK